MGRALSLARIYIPSSLHFGCHGSKESDSNSATVGWNLSQEERVTTLSLSCWDKVWGGSVRHARRCCNAFSCSSHTCIIICMSAVRFYWENIDHFFLIWCIGLNLKLLDHWEPTNRSLCSLKLIAWPFVSSLMSLLKLCTLSTCQNQLTLLCVKSIKLAELQCSENLHKLLFLYTRLHLTVLLYVRRPVNVTLVFHT